MVVVGSEVLVVFEGVAVVVTAVGCGPSKTAAEFTTRLVPVLLLVVALTKASATTSFKGSSETGIFGLASTTTSASTVLAGTVFLIIFALNALTWQLRYQPTFLKAWSHVFLVLSSRSLKCWLFLSLRSEK